MEHLVAQPRGPALQPFDISRHGTTQIWPVRWKPLGDGYDREPFATWWSRHAHDFKHLDPPIVEQWIFRHWCLSPYGFIDPSRLKWRLEEWPSARIIKDVWGDDNRDAKWDMEVLWDTPTGHPFAATGTWDYPIVVYETPGGINLRGRFEPHGHLLIEGHLRTRLLAACMALGKPINASHRVYVIDAG